MIHIVYDRSPLPDSQVPNCYEEPQRRGSNSVPLIHDVCTGGFVIQLSGNLDEVGSDGIPLQCRPTP